MKWLWINKFSTITEFILSVKIYEKVRVAKIKWFSQSPLVAAVSWFLSLQKIYGMFYVYVLTPHFHYDSTLHISHLDNYNSFLNNHSYEVFFVLLTALNISPRVIFFNLVKILCLYRILALFSHNFSKKILVKFNSQSHVHTWMHTHVFVYVYVHNMKFQGKVIWGNDSFNTPL